MYLNESFTYIISSLVSSIINYKIYLFIILSSIVLFGLLLNKGILIKYIVVILNIIISIFILLSYNYQLFSIDIFKHMFHNIYFYFLSSLIFMIICTFMLFVNKLYKITIIFYIISLIFIVFSLFMTYYLNYNYYLIIYNIYPEIVFGNMLYYTYYLLLLVYVINKEARDGIQTI